MASAPTTLQPRTIRIKPPAPAFAAAPTFAQRPAPAMPSASLTGRKLQVMCTYCARVDVWMSGEVIACRRCGKQYDDMLQLIRVTPVGPYEFLFGEGWRGVATGVGVIVGLLALYLLMRGF